MEGEDSTPVCGALYEPSAFYVWRAEIESIQAGVENARYNATTLETEALSARIKDYTAVYSKTYSTVLAVQLPARWQGDSQSNTLWSMKIFHSTYFYVKPQFDIEAILYDYIYLPFYGFYAFR